jgi:hypothetical protein
MLMGPLPDLLELLPLSGLNGSEIGTAGHNKTIEGAPRLCSLRIWARSRVLAMRLKCKRFGISEN